jgi:CBS-domain-containing membrane protein
MRKQVEERTVREVMTPTPVTVRPSTTVGELKALFEAHDFNAFPVVDEAGALCGMVSKLDFLRMFRPARRRWLPDLRAVWAERVGDIMSAGLIAVEPGDAVVVAVDLMVETKLRTLPVVERRGGKPVLVGIVSRKDLLRCLTIEEDRGHA